MRTLLSAFSAVVLVIPGGALASSSVSDADYLRLARCAAIETFTGKPGAFETRLREESRARSNDARFEAARIRETLRLSYDNGGGKLRKAFKAELAGVCSGVAGARATLVAAG